MLTDSEERAYQLMLRAQRRWRYGRYIALLVGLGIAAVGVLLRFQWETNLLTLTRSMSSEPVSGAEVYFASQGPVILALCHLLLPFGFFIAGWAMGRWKGSPATTLLLSVVERLRV